MSLLSSNDFLPADYPTSLYVDAWSPVTFASAPVGADECVSLINTNEALHLICETPDISLCQLSGNE